MPRSAQDTRHSDPSGSVAVRSGGVRPSAEEAAAPRRLIVGYDGSDEARAAFAVAVDRSRPGDTVVVVHAMPPASRRLGASTYERVAEAIPRAAERVLDELRPIAEHVDRQVEFELLEGSPTEALIRAGALRNAHEIVVGSRGLGRPHVALGSVSQQLLREAGRPVLVVGRDAATALATRRSRAWPRVSSGPI
jgi:nucleotide-binding universal stress UspA family protein